MARNRVRRRLRELVCQQPRGAGWDVVMVARPPIVGSSWQELGREAVGLLRRLGVLEHEAGRG